MPKGATFHPANPHLPHFCLCRVLCDPAVTCSELVQGLRGQKSLALEKWVISWQVSSLNCLMTKGNDHMHDAEKAQEKWPQRAAKAGVTGPSHHTTSAMLSNCPWVELCSENTLRAEVSWTRFTARKIYVVLPFCVVEEYRRCTGDDSGCHKVLLGSVDEWGAQPASGVSQQCQLQQQLLPHFLQQSEIRLSRNPRAKHIPATHEANCSKAAVAQELRLDPLVVQHNYSHLNGLLCSKDNGLVQKWNPIELYLSGNFIHIEYRWSPWQKEKILLPWSLFRPASGVMQRRMRRCNLLESKSPLRRL